MIITTTTTTTTITIMTTITITIIIITVTRTIYRRTLTDLHIDDAYIVYFRYAYDNYFHFS